LTDKPLHEMTPEERSIAALCHLDASDHDPAAAADFLAALRDADFEAGRKSVVPVYISDGVRDMKFYQDGHARGRAEAFREAAEDCVEVARQHGDGQMRAAVLAIRNLFVRKAAEAEGGES